MALVLTQGQWLSPRELDEELGITPFVPAVPAVRALAKAPAATGGGGRSGHSRGARHAGAPILDSNDAGGRTGPSPGGACGG